MLDDLIAMELGKVEMKLFFKNGFGISIIRNRYSKGSEGGLFEVAVLHGTEECWKLTYDTPITGDVVGWLDWAAVQNYVGRVALLELKVVETAFD